MITYGVNAAIKMGVDRATLRNWLKQPVKGKIAIRGIVAGYLTLDEYMELPDTTRGSIYNNKLMACMLAQTNSNIHFIPAITNLSNNTVVSLSQYKGHTNSKDVLIQAARGLLISEEIIEDYETQFNKNNI